VHSSTGELPAPKSTKDVRVNFKHLQASQARSLGLGVGNSSHSSNITCHFSKIAFHLPHQFRPQDHYQNRKNISYPMVCLGQETVRWMQSYALRGQFGHFCLRGDPVVGTTRTEQGVLHVLSCLLCVDLDIGFKCLSSSTLWMCWWRDSKEKCHGNHFGQPAKSYQKTSIANSIGMDNPLV